MKFKYTRYTGNDLEGLDLEELVSKLSGLLLDSGFGSPAGDPGVTGTVEAIATQTVACHQVVG